MHSLIRVLSVKEKRFCRSCVIITESPNLKMKQLDTISYIQSTLKMTLVFLPIESGKLIYCSSGFYIFRLANYPTCCSY